MTKSQTPPAFGIERKSRCTRLVIPGDDTITDSTNLWHREKEQMHKTSHTRRWHNHRLHQSLAYRERADAQDQSYQEMTQSQTPPILGIERRVDAQDQTYQEMTQSQTPPTLGTERKSRCTRPVIPGDDTITDSTYPWHREKEQMHKTSHTRRWHNCRFHLPLA